MATRFTVEAVFRGIDRVTAPVTRIQNRVGKLTRSMSAGLGRVNRRLEGMTRGMKRFALGAGVALGIAAAGFANIISVGAGFEQTLVTAAVKFPGAIDAGTGALLRQTEQFKKLEAEARRVGRTTEFTASQAASGLNFLAMAGFEADASITALAGTVDLATIAQIDLGRATDIATDTMGAFNLLTGDAATKQKNLARVSDILVSTSISANTSLEQMFEALVAGAPVAVAAGTSIEDIAAFIGIMANAGIKGSKAGRSMKNMIANLAAPGSKAAKVLDDLGVETQDISKDMNRALTIFQRFGAATKGLGSAETLAKFDVVFGKIALAASLNIANATDAVGSLSQELKENIGITRRMAALIRDTFEGRMKAMKSAIESVKLEIFDMTKGALSPLLDEMIKWVRLNENLIATNVGDFILGVANNIGSILAVTAKVGVALLVFFTLVTVLKAVAAIMTIVNFIMLANPMVLMVTAAVALIAAVITLIVFWDEFLDLLRETPKLIENLKLDFLEKVFKRLGFGVFAGPAASLLGAADPAKTPKPFVTEKRSLDRLLRGLAPSGESRLLSTGKRDFGDLFLFERALVRAMLGAVLGTGEPQVVSPSERTATSIEESRTTSSVDITIRPESGTEAEVTSGVVPSLSGIRLLPSGSP